MSAICVNQDRIFFENDCQLIVYTHLSRKHTYIQHYLYHVTYT